MSQPPTGASAAGDGDPARIDDAARFDDDEPDLDLDPDAEAGADHPPVASLPRNTAAATDPPVDGAVDEAGGAHQRAESAAADGEADSDTDGDVDGDTGSSRRRSKHRARPKRAPWWELPALIVLAVLIAIVVKTFLIQPFYIPSASMEHTLYGAPNGGDRILVNKLIYDVRDPHPGDIVVFNAPPGWDEVSTTPPSNPVLHGIHWFGQLVGFVPPDGEVLVKRVIATGGETIWGDQAGQVHVRTAAGRGKVLTEPYVYESGLDTRQTFGPVTVPKGRLWVMGDHRSDSQDSRYHCGTDGGDDSYGKTCDPTGSTVPVDNVIGKAFVVAWPPSHWRTLGTPPTFTGLAAAADRVVPTASGALVVVPLAFARRRRRRRRG